MATTEKVASASGLKPYEDTIAKQIHEANTKIDQFEVAAKAKRAQAEIAAVKGLKIARQNIEHMLHDLGAKGATELEKAKVDIDKAMVALHKSLEEFSHKYTTSPEKGSEKAPAKK